MTAITMILGIVFLAWGAFLTTFSIGQKEAVVGAVHLVVGLALILISYLN